MTPTTPGRSTIAALGALLVMALAAVGARAGEAGADSAGYDPARDPAADLRAAVDEARESGRRILLEVGGEWCIWCHRLEAFVAGDPEVRALWDGGFVSVKVNYSDENHNEEFLSRYPEVDGYPHLFVLDTDGSLLHSQGTGELEAGKGYSKQAVTAFLERWAPLPAG